MRRRWQIRRPNEAGYSLLTVTVFVFVVMISAAAFFAMASYETKGALHRQRSSEAFYVADGAIERARAKFLEDRSWRAGWSGDSLGRGVYDLSVTDTTFPGADNVVYLRADGTVRAVQRSIGVFATVPPSALGLTLLIMGDATVGGNLCLAGAVHVNGSADFGPQDAHLKCGGTYTTGDTINPPPIYTEVDSFPNATYYKVRGTKIGSTYQARIYNGNDVDITTALGDSLVDVTTYNPGQKIFTFEFKGAADINKYFDDATGIFGRNAGDIAVVINFGEEPVINPPGSDGITKLIIDANPNQVINATVINTRFTGATLADRYDYRCWKGGVTLVKQIIWEPYYGVALVVHDFQKQGGSLVRMGTPTWPALVYVTQDAVWVNANFELCGSMICLGNWNSTGGPDMIYNGAFMANLPDYLMDTWPQGSAGTLQVLRWRELAASSE
ncbi:MAG: hypothetical protein KAY32_01035 [Candidatus Eisenbacteria sp.]|nr:hypothetical protein [Candidatus Eisenbacteria bacterium]